MITNLSENGKAFSFMVPSDLQTDDLMAAVEEALTFYSGSTPDQIAALLSARPIKDARISFGRIWNFPTS